MSLRFANPTALIPRPRVIALTEPQFVTRFWSWQPDRRCWRRAWLFPTPDSLRPAHWERPGRQSAIARLPTASRRSTARRRGPEHGRGGFESVTRGCRPTGPQCVVPVARAARTGRVVPSVHHGGLEPLADIQQCLRITRAIRIPQDVVVAHLFACARQPPVQEPHERVRPETDHGDPLDQGDQHVAPQDVGAFVLPAHHEDDLGKTAEEGR